MKKGVLFFFLCFGCLLLFVGCLEKSEEKADLQSFQIYFRNQGKYELYPVTAEIDTDSDRISLIDSVYLHMKEGASETDYTSPIADQVELLDFFLDDTGLVFDFSSYYLKLGSEEEVIMRAALVRTFTQIEGIQTVEIRVEGQPLALPDGTLTGAQKGTSFVDVIADGLNDYVRTDITLFFASDTGNRLRACERSVAYEGKYTREQYLLQCLIKGPLNAEEGEPLFPAGVKVLSIDETDGICHLNLNEAILEDNVNVLPEVMIYGIVNTLVSVDGITGVRITINGSSNYSIMDKIDLNKTLSMNRDLLEDSVKEN